MSERYLWLTLFLLGCYHGLNPGMGWLFAVALGFQERRIIAVLGAIVPLTFGHLVSVAIVVVLAVAAAGTFPHWVVHYAAGAILLAFGTYRLVRARHPRWVGMRVGFWGLALWGFLMSSAHGAGLMLMPLVPMAGSHGMGMSWMMISIHTLGYLATMTLVAVAVYRWFGVSFLRKGWLNVDFIWAVALLLTGIIALVT